jgi:hypothetical protein
MPIFKSNIQATTNGSTNTFDQFIEIKAAASTTYLIRRIRVTPGDSSAAPADNQMSIKLLRNSAAGTATAGTTPVATKNRINAPASGATLVGKNAANNFTVGTNTDTPIWASVNERNGWEWIPADQTEVIEHSATGVWIAVAIACSAASRRVNVEIEWEE